MSSLESMVQCRYWLCWLISPIFIINPAILPIKKVRYAGVFIIALIILREESELS